MRVDATNPRHCMRFKIIDARTGQPFGVRRIGVIYADDKAHVLGVRYLADVLQGDYEVREISVPRVVIDLDRNTVLINVAPPQQLEASRASEVHA